MRPSVTVVDPATGTWQDVLLDVEPGTPVREVAEVLARQLQQLPTGVVRLGAPRGAAATALAPRLFVDGLPLDPEAPVGSTALRDGALVSLDSPDGCVRAEPDGLVEVRVVSGAGAGAVHRLGVGEATIGTDPVCAVVLDAGVLDAGVPGVAAVVRVDATGAATVHRPGSATDGGRGGAGDRASSAAVELDREPLAGPVAWVPGAQLRLGGAGGVLLELALPEAPDAAVAPAPDGTVHYNRPPRLLPPQRPTTFRSPVPPAEPQRRGVPFIAALSPLVMGVVVALVYHRTAYVLIGALTPLVVVGNWWYDRRIGRRQYHEDLARYRERAEQVLADARDAVVTERRDRRDQALDPAALLLLAVGPRARLWERRREHPDHLRLRVGTGDVPSSVVVEDPERPDHRRKVVQDALDVPVTLDLAARGVVGVAGGAGLPRRLAAGMVAQLAVLQSPRDVTVHVLTDPAGAPAWAWVRWLPHTRPGGASSSAGAGQEAVALVGADTESLSRRVAELTGLVTARQRAVREAGGSTGNTRFEGPDVVVVLDGARRLRLLPGVAALLREGPAVGVRAICLDEDARSLPEECTAVVTATAAGLQVRSAHEDDVDGVRPDLVGDPWLARVARAVAPLRDTSDEAGGGALPSSSRLLDVLGLEPPTAAAVGARWVLGGRTTEAVVGESLDGAFSLDLRRDGPHALVAGTTGSGKSELLQTLVASLAVGNRPDAMTFVLVDYKGGAAFKDCVDLPHTVGMVTDLDDHLVARALTSLSAELTRREHVLAAVGAKDLEDYLELADRSTGTEAPLAPLPRLAIVIDEFASLARELPDFVTGLVNIAQRGRSLGIHLVLATQRPSGVVSPEIRANTNLRIALRVTDAGESTDVLDAADAAGISRATPGRAFVRLGGSSPVPFQAGRVGGRRPGSAPARARAPWAVVVAPGDLGRPAPAPPRAPDAPGEVEETDLRALVRAVREAARTAGVPEQHSPWLPALPARLLLGALWAPGEVHRAASAGPTVSSGPAGQLPPLPYGLEDTPRTQAQQPAVFDLQRGSHLYVVGSPRSGRSQVLRTLAAAVAERTSAADVHLYALDCGGGALLPLADLPHCGAVVTRTQTERAQRLLVRLTAEVAARQEVLAAGGFADLAEQRAAAAPPDRLPHVVVLLDRWEGFLATFGDLDHGAMTDQVVALLREGASTGVHLVVTGDRQLLTGRMSTLSEDALVLRLADRGDYSLAGLNPRSVPTTMPEGRGLRSGTGTEVQVALIAQDPAGAAQAEALGLLAARAATRDAALPRARRPFRVDVLPARLGFEQAWQLREERTDRPLWGLVGVGGDELLAVGPDLGGGGSPTFIAGGPPASGRSSLLLAMTRSFLRQGADVVIAAPRPSPLRDLAGRGGVRAVLTGEDLTTAELEPLLDPALGPVALVVDDAELLKDVEARTWLRDLVRTARHRQLAVVVAGDAEAVGSGFSGWQVELRKNRCGAVLSPANLTDGDLVGVRLPRSAVGGPVQPGRALVHLGDGELVVVAVPAP